jgi:type IV secretory pathway VirB2 component (pilin)
MDLLRTVWGSWFGPAAIGIAVVCIAVGLVLLGKNRSSLRQQVGNTFLIFGILILSLNTANYFYGFVNTHKTWLE